MASESVKAPPGGGVALQIAFPRVDKHWNPPTPYLAVMNSQGIRHSMRKKLPAGS